jgi:putative spermidine/putrescine transport system permease protein
MTLRRTLILLLGWSMIAALLTPLAYAAWVSFSPDSFLQPPRGQWSLRWYLAFLSDRRWMEALARSFFVAIGATAVSLAAGTPLAYAVARHRFFGHTAISGMVMLPVCVPPAVLGMGLLPLVFVSGLWGNPLGLILAHGLVGLPIVFLIARTHFDHITSDLEAAARGLGATPLQAAYRVTLPLLRPALLAGAGAAFAVSFNESMVTLFLATPTTETLPAMVWPQLRYSASPMVAVASCVSVAVATVVVGVVMAVGDRSMKDQDAK